MKLRPSYWNCKDEQPQDKETILGDLLYSLKISNKGNQNEDKEAEEIQQKRGNGWQLTLLIQASLVQKYLIQFLYQDSYQTDCFLNASSHRHLSSRDRAVDLVYYIAGCLSRVSPYSLSVWEAFKYNEMNGNKKLLLLLLCISWKLKNILSSWQHIVLSVLIITLAILMINHGYIGWHWSRCS